MLIGQISLVGSWVWCNKCLCFKFYWAVLGKGATNIHQISLVNKLVIKQLVHASNFFGNGAG
jgi:hypothetical protein